MDPFTLLLLVFGGIGAAVSVSTDDGSAVDPDAPESL